MTEPIEKPRRRQFSLVSLFVAIAVLGVCFALLRLMAIHLEIPGWKLGVTSFLAFGVACGNYREWRASRNRPVRFISSLRQVALCLYLPFSWLVLIDYPWSDYHWFWMGFWPVLPGFLPGAVFFHNSAIEFFVMGFVTLLLLLGLSWLGTRGRYGLIAATVLALCVSVPTALASYGAFFM